MSFRLPSEPRVAMVGATGAVGHEFLRVLAQRHFPMAELTLFASARSAGARVTFTRDGRAHELPVMPLEEGSLAGFDLVFFSAGKSVSKAFAPAALAAGAVVVDNSSAFRMAPECPLVVPEVNGELLDRIERPAIIANPNCSTIIALVAVHPLHQRAKVKRMVVSTYQAASGAGARAMAELEQQARDFAEGRPLQSEIFGRQYLFNCFSHNSTVGGDGYNEEETKLLLESRRIWNDPTVAITATCVRVPTLRAHCESINLSFETPLGEDEARELLTRAPGVEVIDDRAANRFPEPLLASGRDPVLVGRIRADLSQPAGVGLNLFVAGDQIRKGAALNAVQIAERLLPQSRRSSRSAELVGGAGR
ncbi:MAG: aspartate-semialdehyde dehydrogenase [Phycisphaeraceae bacterium]|nr:aspartate-semialdehyde dehydrogenase [Phycisphaeraceae bacterium]